MAAATKAVALVQEAIRAEAEAMAADSGAEPAEEEVRRRAAAASSKTRTPWPLWKLIILAIPQFGVQVLWCFIGPNAAPYMMHLGVGPALATLNNIAGPTTGFFTGPIVGAWSDRLQSRWGRRRPVILGGLVSTAVAGLLFSSSEHLFESEALKIAFAVPMYWCLDVTINILQTPHRALVADLASEEQQVPLQVVFVVMMAVGNFVGYSIMQIYPVPTEHMLELMFMMVAINATCVGIQFLFAKEEPLRRADASEASGCCSAVTTIMGSIRGMPRLLYHLVFVQCLVWLGNTAWNYYGAQWFANSVYQGDQNAPEGSPEKLAYAAGMAAYTRGGQLRSNLQLASALLIIALLLLTSVRPRLVYGPCIYVGCLISLLAAFAVGHNGTFAIVCWTVSIMPETGSFAIPFGLVATLNRRAQEEGKQVSTALQMALLNCCVTVGQEVCHMVLSYIEHRMELSAALPCVFMMAGAAYAISGSSALCLDDAPKEPRAQTSDSDPESGSSSDSSSSDSE